MVTKKKIHKKFYCNIGKYTTHPKGTIKCFILNCINGVYSGIPCCCTVAFARIAYAGFPPGKYKSDQRGKHGPRYVQCDKCFDTNHVIKPKKNGTWHLDINLRPFRLTICHITLR